MTMSFHLTEFLTIFKNPEERHFHFFSNSPFHRNLRMAAFSIFFKNSARWSVIVHFLVKIIRNLKKKLYEIFIDDCVFKE